eukprot:CAMPEP_0198108042 /NCGR_PEP_ID=MMETSP1442-20131203/127_1 /TAXON_ID= /ORGANISM="Craspedostauros australis, Strain CCMP3328" /LENGTH=125 /DNA_ID=CAMNT_0043763235 /DNA_START=96 /DNA_END=473 /DNA_ORIENTATION=+
MGNSSSSSYHQYHNDFELVIRVAKDLEHTLEQACDVDLDDRTIGLQDKITIAERQLSLSRETIKQLRYLVTLRNKLVHDPTFNKLPDRKAFATTYEKAGVELHQKIKEHGRGGGGSSESSGCVIS